MVHTDIMRKSFVFCKQKTAYEMRISDWSSDVCAYELDCTADCSTAPGIGSACVERLLARCHRVYMSWSLHGQAAFIACVGQASGLPSHRRPRPGHHQTRKKIGRASCRERVCQNV